MPVTGDQVQAQSLEEDSTPSRTLQGTLEILDVPAWEYYLDPFTAYFVDGQEADETTITVTTEQPPEPNTVTAAKAPVPAKGPYDRYTSVFEAAEKLSGNHPYGSQGTLSYYSDVQRQAVRIANHLPTEFIEDRDFLREAAILMSAIPQSPLSPGALYRGTQEFEVSRKRDGIEVFDQFDMPLAPATPRRKTAESFAKGLLIKIETPVPWIKTEGTAKLEEGFISGRFIVTAITYSHDLKVITVTQTADYLEAAYAILAENGWDYGEDVSFNLTASAALVLPKLYDYTKIYDDNNIFAQMKTFYKYFDQFHLPGGHEQKSHGGGSGSDAVAPAFPAQDEQRPYTPLSPEEEEAGYASVKPIEYPEGYKEASEAWVAKLTPEERRAAADYTGSYLFDRINANAVAGKPDPSVDALDSALAKAPKRDTPIRVYRRASFKDRDIFMQSIHVGDEISLAQPGAFQSTSVTSRFPVATGWPTGSVVFEINTRSGAAIGDVTQGGGTARELEVLIPRSTKFRVVAIQHDVQFGPPPKTRGYGDTLKRLVVQVEEV